MACPLETLAEMVRVLTPGGVLYLTNRVGWEARLLPRRALSRPAFEQALARHSLADIRVRRWQVNYDLALARKEGQHLASGRQEMELAFLLRCPACGGRMQRAVASLSCGDCGQTYPIREGVLDLVIRDSPEAG